MRTTVDIPAELLAEARKVSATRSIRDTVVAALEEMVRKGRRQGLRKLAGTMELKIDLKRSRERKSR